MEEWERNAKCSIRDSPLYSLKRETLSSVTAWVRTKIRFTLLRSALMCVRGILGIDIISLTSKKVNMDLEMRDSAIREE